MGQQPFALDASVDDAKRALVSLPFAAIGPVLEVVFPAATTARDIAHGLRATPDGYFVVLESGGFVRAIDVSRWTETIAWLEATAVNTRARVCFYTLRKGAITHVVP